MTARIGAASTPASPASATPKPNTGVTQRPDVDAEGPGQLGRSVAARTTMPTRVRVSSSQTRTQTTTANAEHEDLVGRVVEQPEVDRPASSGGGSYGCD